MPEAVLRFDRVSKHFTPSGAFLRSLLAGRSGEAIKAVDDVSFQLWPGEILGLIGQSGSGKTTTGQLAVRLLEPTAGTIAIGGHDLARLSGECLRRARRDFQVVFQNPYQSLNPRMTLGRLLEEPLRVHAPELARPERFARVQETLEGVGLAPAAAFLGRYPHQLSGGQRQRAAIGRAVILRPRLLVADEPVSMLDVSVRAGILRLLLDLRRDLGMALLFITHDLAVGKHVCDRIAVMHAGRIVETGPAKEVLSRPAHAYTRTLIEAVPDLRALTGWSRAGNGEAAGAAER